MSNEISIAGRKIGAAYSPYVIAEMSANHNGNIETAFRIIEEAKKAGADAIKMQTYTADTLTLNCDLPDFQINDGLWAGRMLIASQAVLWSAIALNDLVIARHQVMHKVLRYSVGFLALALVLGWLALAWLGLSLEKFVLIHSCVMLSFYVAQSWIMNLLGLRLVRVWVTTVALYLLLAFVGIGISYIY
jgi:hypothetical protein